MHEYGVYTWFWPTLHLFQSPKLFSYTPLANHQSLCTAGHITLCRGGPTWSRKYMYAPYTRESPCVGVDPLDHVNMYAPYTRESPCVGVDPLDHVNMYAPYTHVNRPV
jgi:hypothetical protein